MRRNESLIKTLQTRYRFLQSRYTNAVTDKDLADNIIQGSLRDKIALTQELQTLRKKICSRQSSRRAKQEKIKKS